VDPLGPDFEFLVQKIAALQRRCPCCYFASVFRHLMVVQDKKVDGMAQAQSEFRSLTQRARFAPELNVIADYPGLLDEALADVPFCYQLFYPTGERFREEMGCLASEMESEIRRLATAYEREERRRFEKEKAGKLRKLGYESLAAEDRARLVLEVNRTNRQRSKARKAFYTVGPPTMLDSDLLVQGGTILFSGMQITLMRSQAHDNPSTVVLAVTDEEFLPDYLSQLKEISKDAFVVFLIKDCWQFNIRSVKQQYPELAQFSIVADEFGLFDRVANVCGRNNCLVKAQDGRIIKVVAAVKDLEESEEELAARESAAM